MALDFLILYEHTVREYESDLLLKLELERRGYTVEIRQLLDPKHLRLFGKDKPEVLVASCMYDNEAINSHVYNNIGKCNKIVNLHWEQMLSDTQEEGDWFNMNGNAKRCVQTCWGKRTAARLQAHGMDAKNTPVTGAVMMDFLRPEFDGYFKDKQTLCKEFGLDPAKQLHLYISSFGYASMNDDEVAELSKMAGTDFTGFAKTNRVSMKETLRWFDEYLGQHPEVELVYRRHPSEWNSPALEELAKMIQSMALCGLGKSAPLPVLSTLATFRDEYVEHIVDKRCRAKQCTALRRYVINPAFCKGCSKCARNCPVNAISGVVKKPYTIDSNKCIKCGACKENCAFDAIYIEA